MRSSEQFCQALKKKCPKAAVSAPQNQPLISKQKKSGEILNSGHRVSIQHALTSTEKHTPAMQKGEDHGENRSIR
jgi:hypothetical protein